MEIPESARQGIYKCLGAKSKEYLSQVDKRLEKYVDLWKLYDLAFMPTDTVNFLFSCRSALYKECVLKMCIPGPEVAAEVGCLRAYDGKGYCNLWAYDLSDDVLLLERIIPGEQMWSVKDYRERARLMATTIKGLPIPYDGSGQYPTYLSWMEEIHRKLTDMGGLEDVLFFLNEAMKIYAELKHRHHQECLLHGDLHQENLLLNSSGGYTIIDPKGVVDDPIMETSRFLINEMPCEKDKIIEMAEIMSPIISVSVEDILKSMYVDTALSHSWRMEEHFHTREAFDEAKQEAIDTCKFVHGLMKE
ncbi:streptomycin 6-kinase [Lachnospiraceae bacterium PF1-22]|uniref:aminoglycoside phosphotransferase family protein n=1 Tax=Ohessyouella blattaphilus TaxID=2949333 RepID=UPI003E25BFB3